MTIISFYKIFSLCKIPKYHLIFWYANFVENHSLSTKFPHQKIRWNFGILCSVLKVFFQWECTLTDSLHQPLSGFLENNGNYKFLENLWYFINTLGCFPTIPETLKMFLFWNIYIMSNAFAFFFWMPPMIFFTTRYKQENQWLCVIIMSHTSFQIPLQSLKKLNYHIFLAVSQKVLWRS